MPLPVTVVVSRRATAGSEKELTEWAQALCHEAARFRGYVGCKVKELETADTVQVVIGLSFADVDTLARWERSDERAARLAEGTQLTEGAPTPLTIQSLGELWVADPAHPAAGLPRWLSAALVWVALFPPALALNVLVAPLLHEWSVVARTLMTSIVLVPVVFYITLPLLNRVVWSLWPGRPAGQG